MTRTPAIVGLLAVVGGVVAVRAADPPPAPHHLVGHEDAALLVRVQDVIDDWDPRKLVNPLVETSEAIGPDGKVVVRRQLRRSDLAEFVADVDAMEALGKAFFWEMQAGSDFRRVAADKYVGTACASCHYRHGADARTRYATRVPYVVWDKYKLDPAHDPLEYGEAQQPFNVVAESVRVYDPAQYRAAGPFSLIVGSAGVEPRIFAGFAPDPGGAGAWEAEKSRKRPLTGFAEPPQWAMFVAGQADAGKRYRQLTTRNSPTVFNSGFSDRLFHDGRAESTFNGFSIFGDADRREVIHKAVITPDATGKEGYREPVPVHVAVTRAALASQSVGPVVNDVEMSYLGRTFPNLAYRLLRATPLKHQAVADGDSILGPWKAKGAVGGAAAGTYRDLVKRAFRREWWDGRSAADEKAQYPVPLVLMRDDCGDGRTPTGELMEANFSLYWGLSLMFYQATLVSNRSPFDDMLRGRPEAVNRRWEQVKGQFGQVKVDSVPRDKARVHPNGASVFQHGFRVFLTRGCVECHGGPLFSDAADRRPEHERFPIQSRVDRTLLPVSQAEAIALKYQAARAETLTTVAGRVVASGVTTKARAAAVAVHLDALREEARGDRDRLTGLVAEHLGRSLAAKTPREIAEALIRFEQTVPRRFGDRAFFDEDARVAAADALVGGVRVEKMAIPNTQVPTRPRLPIGGLLASDPYAFYDGGFYNLGVSPPRYDRGIGARVGIPDPEEALDTLIGRLEFPAGRVPTPAENEQLEKARDYKAAPPAKRAGLGREVPELVEKERAKAASRSATASAPGRAYRFDRRWARPPAPGVEPPGPPRKTDEGIPTDCDPDRDGKVIAGGKDTSWDREELPPETRRADLFFLSRARRLVTTEDPWGFRKPFLHDHELAFWGAFRVPTLRNVELTAPYMHNGRFMSLLDVVNFYEMNDDLDRVRFVRRDVRLNPDVHPQMVRLSMTQDDKLALVFFLMCLTDERVRTAAAPFDHPGLRLVHGYAAGGSEIDELISPGPVP